ncbi:MAG: sulfite exporter TauE/SafE family protein [Microcystaceae cyanobacterium]
MILTILIFITAILYSSVGHAGASGYLAVMALMGISPTEMKPTALALNIFVALIATVKFYRVKAFSLAIFWPLVMGSIPCAFIGGTLSLPSYFYKPIIGLILIYAAGYSLYRTGVFLAYQTVTVSKSNLFISGGFIGLLSGLTGVGGGIFLSPLLLLNRWAEVRTISGISAAFILVNSIAGLWGTYSQGMTLNPNLPLWGIAAILGGFIGSDYGSKYLSNKTIQFLLAILMAIAGIKMITVFN